jgi:hypothetical protein
VKNAPASLLGGLILSKSSTDEIALTHPPKTLKMAKPLRVALLSTYYENTGDDLIREGVQYLVSAILGTEPQWCHISKANRLSLLFPRSKWTHAPISRMRKRTQAAASQAWRIARAMRLDRCDKLRNADVLVIAGTPLFYFVGESDFVSIERIYGDNWPLEILSRLERYTKLRCVALGVGSIYEGAPASIVARFPEATRFIRRLVERSTLVATRDCNTDQLLRAAVPNDDKRIFQTICPSFWAIERLGIGSGVAEKRVAISFSLESVNWDLSLPRDRVLAMRKDALEVVILHLKARGYAISVLAHNRYDVEAIRALPAAWDLSTPDVSNSRQLITSVATAQAVVTWRVHGALAALSAGRPALLFGTDSRHFTASALGAHILDDRFANASMIRETLDRLLDEGDGDAAERRLAANPIRVAEFERIREPLLAALSVSV